MDTGRSRYEHAALRCDRTDAGDGCGEGTEADQKDVLNLPAHLSANDCVGRLNRCSFSCCISKKKKRLYTSGDESVQELWKPHGGLDN